MPAILLWLIEKLITILGPILLNKLGSGAWDWINKKKEEKARQDEIKQAAKLYRDAKTPQEQEESLKNLIDKSRDN